LNLNNLKTTPGIVSDGSIDSQSFLNEILKINNVQESFVDFISSSTNSIIYVYDVYNKDKNICFCNSAVTILGFSLDEVKNNNINFLETVISPDDIIPFKQFQRDLVLDSKINSSFIEITCLHKQTKAPIQVNVFEKVLTCDENDRVQYVIGIAYLNSDKTNYNQTHQLSSLRTSLVISSNEKAIWEWSKDSDNQAWFSDLFFSSLGYANLTENYTKSFFKSIIHPKHKELFNISITNFIEGFDNLNLELMLISSQGNYEWYHLKADLYNDTYNSEKVIGVIENIHSKKEDQLRINNLQSEIDQLTFIAAHDLKEPLNTIKSFSYLFKDEYQHVFDDDAQLYLDYMDQAVDRMRKLIDGLLSHSQINNELDNFKQIDLNIVLKCALVTLNDSIIETGAHIEYENLPKVNGVDNQILQIFIELLSNGLKYSKPYLAPNIKLGCTQNANKYVFYVKDEGIGIEDKDISDVFNIFKKLHMAYEYEGVGIGLANCKKIIQNHGGKIWCESQQGVGTTFYFTLPSI